MTSSDLQSKLLTRILLALVSCNLVLLSIYLLSIHRRADKGSLADHPGGTEKTGAMRNEPAAFPVQRSRSNPPDNREAALTTSDGLPYPVTVDAYESGELDRFLTDLFEFPPKNGQYFSLSETDRTYLQLKLSELLGVVKQAERESASIVNTEDGGQAIMLPPDPVLSTRITQRLEDIATSFFGSEKGHLLARLWASDPAVVRIGSSFREISVREYTPATSTSASTVAELRVLDEDGNQLSGAMLSLEDPHARIQMLWKRYDTVVDFEALLPK